MRAPPIIHGKRWPAHQGADPSARLTPTGRRAFTLVEILTASAIVAILSGILLPVVVRARERGRLIQCANGMSQIGRAIDLYLQDWDDTYPSFRVDPLSAARADRRAYWHDRFCDGLDLAPGQPCWATLIGAYLKAPSVLFCPSDVEQDERPATSYELKPALAEGRSRAEVPDPTDTALLWEQWAYHIYKAWTYGDYSEYDRRSQMNILFVDGHVKWERLADSTSARYGDGPDLHPLTDMRRPPAYRSRDF